MWCAKILNSLDEIQVLGNVISKNKQTDSVVLFFLTYRFDSKAIYDHNTPYYSVQKIIKLITEQEETFNFEFPWISPYIQMQPQVQKLEQTLKLEDNSEELLVMQLTKHENRFRRHFH